MPIYEALVKITDNVNESLSPEQQESALYKAGDIVVVREKGWNWGRLEVKQFLIVELGEMTEEEARALEEDVSVHFEEPIEERDPEELELPPNVSSETVARRRFNINIDELVETLGPGERFAKRLRILDLEEEEQPFREEVHKHMIEDKEERQEVKDRIAQKKAKGQVEGRKLVPREQMTVEGIKPLM